jgi:Kef-type K+ transport system membrane component KefB
MIFTLWYVVVGLLLVGMALSGTLPRRLPLSTALIYLAAGVALGPVGLGLIRLDPLAGAGFLERFAEVAVIVSLFTAGLKLRLPLRDPLWRIAARLAFGSMSLTVGLIALVGTFLLGLPLGASVLLGAVLAPTDPVLASDVQVEAPTDRDPLRFALTGEAGLNDGTAFPFVMLGLGLLGMHEIGVFGWRWLVVDLLWAVAAGLGIGWGLGALVARLVLYLRRAHREAVGTDDFLALGLISLSYGLALLAHAYGFLAVFAAGLALRHLERRASGEEPPVDVKDAAVASEELATDPEKAPAYMAEAVLGFNRAARTHPGAGDRAARRRHPGGRRPAARGVVVRAVDAAGHPPDRRGAGPARRRRRADALGVALLVRHPGHRLAVLPDARDRVWPPRTPGPPPDRPDPGRRGHVDRRARGQRDALDAPVSRAS